VLLFTLNQDTELNLEYSSSLKQHSDRISWLKTTSICSFCSMLIALGTSSKCHMKVFALTMLYIEPAIISTRGDVIEH